MKSKLFFAFAIVAAFASVLLSSCGKDSSTTTTNGCIDFTGTDTGQHTVFINGIPNLVPPIRDTFNISIGTNGKVNILSHALGQTLVGTKDAVDCNKVVLDSLIYGPTDTLRIHSDNPLFASLNGNIKIWGIHAGGNGSINSTGAVTTELKIVRGHTNVDALGGILLDLYGKNLSLTGNFIKFP